MAYGSCFSSPNWDDGPNRHFILLGFPILEVTFRLGGSIQTTSWLVEITKTDLIMYSIVLNSDATKKYQETSVSWFIWFWSKECFTMLHAKGNRMYLGADHPSLQGALFPDSPDTPTGGCPTGSIFLWTRWQGSSELGHSEINDPWIQKTSKSRKRIRNESKCLICSLFLGPLNFALYFL
jgi:hypothetical protein